MKFTKMQGIGNDYVYVNCFEEKVEDPSALAIQVSDRHFGIGSDGLILICPSEVADCEMAMYNADGSRGEMCGNGVRCVGKYMYDYGLTDKTEITVETLAGIKTLQLFVENGKVAKVRVDMGSPILTPAEIPVVAEGDKAVDEPILVDAGRLHSQEIRITGTVSPTVRSFAQAVDCIAKGIIGVKPLIEKVYDYTDIKEALEAAMRPETFKVLVKFSE